MFLGHFGVGLGAKAAAPRPSLGTLFLSAQWLDLVWPTLVLLGIEVVDVQPGITAVTPLDFEHYPYTHSLAAVIGWAGLFALVYGRVRRNRRGAAVVGLLVVSHWVLDAVVHTADLPLWPGGPQVGLGLWNSLPATLAVELPLFAAGAWIYLRTTRPADAVGRWAAWGLIGFLAVLYAANLFGPPPPSEAAVAWAGQAQWLLVAWAYWVDRHREPVRGLQL